MKKKDFLFTFGLTLFAGIVWIIGELVMGLWIPVYPWVKIVWRALIIVSVLAVSVWHSLVDDEIFKKSREEEKYERKVNRRKNSK